ncbi:MAG: type III-A CRISPR-associated protein Csm2 [Phycisphaerae bacterium]|jgi:CRISPR type III-A-associated protein Csm2|nr:type III-A CRISPR-associated protein Csm2 [Phycisphaerae bacterium]
MAQMYQNNHRQQPFRGGRSPSLQPPATPSVPVKFYLDAEKTQLNPTLLNVDAEKQADQLHQKINSAQIRRFFGEIKNLSLRLQQGRPWTQIEPLFRMLRSKAAYASGTSKITSEFSTFISENVDRVKDQRDFEAFVLYFEAMLGFAYGKGLVKK